MKPKKPWSLLVAFSSIGAWACFDVSTGLPQSESASDHAELPFSAKASAIPFPPDSRSVEFGATFGDIEFTSRSSLASLVDFYRREMKRRGWEEDQSAAVIESDSIELTFKHDDALVELELDLGSDQEVDVNMDCEEIDFAGTNDPATLLAAGVPQPRSYVFLQQEIQLPEDIRDLEYGDDECHFKSRMELPVAFDHFANMIKQLGFRESRQPIITDSRRYTEFRRGPIELSVNIFTDDYGTRILIGYENDQQETVVAPLPEVAPLVASNHSGGGTESGTSTPAAPTESEKQPIDVASNKGEAIVNYEGKKHVFQHVAAYQSKFFGEDMMLIFSSRPFPFQKMQSLISTNDDFSYSDLYEFSLPDHLKVQLGNSVSFSFSLPGIVLGDSVDNPERDVKIEHGRIRATVKMPVEEVFDDTMSFTATVDAAIMTSDTRLANFTDPPPAAASGLSLGGSGLPLPEGVSDAYSEGTPYRKSTRATAKLSFDEIAAFYRAQLSAEGWKEDESAQVWQVTGDDSQRHATLVFQKSEGLITLNLKPSSGGIAIDASTRDDTKARRDGILPEPGKGRLIMGNAHSQAVVISVGKSNYTLKPGQGADEPKSALNYSVGPGPYTLTIKIPGQQPQVEKLEISAGTAWGVIVLPTGGYLASQLY